MELTWREGLIGAAWFFDGEGYVGFQRRTEQNSPRVAIGISQNDRYVLDRFRDAVDIGDVYGPYGRRDQLFYYQVGGFERVQAIIALLWSFLGPVKRLQARSALEQARAIPTYLHVCRRGHPRTPENTYVRASGRTCRLCYIEHEKAFRVRHADRLRVEARSTANRKYHRTYQREWRKRRLVHALLVAV